MKKAFVVIAGGLLIVALSRCGEPVCVAGFGQCRDIFRNAEPSEGSGSGGISRNIFARITRPTILPNGVSQIEISGGTRPYNVSFEDSIGAPCQGGDEKVDGQCTLTPKNESTWSFKARMVERTVQILITDSKGLKANYSITIDASVSN